MPPIATEMKPYTVKKRPPSNCSDTIGPIAIPLSAPSTAAAVYEKTRTRSTSIPISVAADGFSAHARSAFPNVVRCSTYHSASDDDRGDCRRPRTPASESCTPPSDTGW